MEGNDMKVRSHKPAKLSHLAAQAVARALIYEDYEECCYYRWDPVRIWQFENPQPKKKKSKKKAAESPEHESSQFAMPPPPWTFLKHLRDWWMDESASLLGSVHNSPVRHAISSAVEQRSWSSTSEEEDVLFFLLRLFLDTKLCLGKTCSKCIPSQWCVDVALIIEQMGPFPIQKLFIFDDMFSGSPQIVCNIIQNSPKLQVLKIGQWEISNSILLTLGCHCSELQEFTIHGMEAGVYMSDEALFGCFFSGLNLEDIKLNQEAGTPIPLSFKNLKSVNILHFPQTMRLFPYLAVYYPNVTLGSFNATDEHTKLEDLALPFTSIGARVTSSRVTIRTCDILDRQLPVLLSKFSCIKELRLSLEKNIPFNGASFIYNDYLKQAGVRLKEIVDSVPTVDSLFIRPQRDVPFSKVLYPTVFACGEQIKVLHFLFDLVEVPLGVVFDIVNMCPQLQQITFRSKVTATFKPSLVVTPEIKEHNQLECFSFHNADDFVCSETNASPEEEESDVSSLSTIAYLTENFVQKCPNLKTLSIECTASSLPLFRVVCPSIQQLHIHLLSLDDDDDSSSNDKNETCTGEASLKELLQFIICFPNMQILYLNGHYKSYWYEGLDELRKLEFRTSMQVPDFAAVPQWETFPTSSSNLNISVIG